MIVSKEISEEIEELTGARELSKAVAILLEKLLEAIAERDDYHEYDRQARNLYRWKRKALVAGDFEVASELQTAKFNLHLMQADR